MSDTLQRPAIHGSASSDGANLQIIMNMTKKKQQKNCRGAAEYRLFIGKDTKFLLFRKSQGSFL